MPNYSNPDSLHNWVPKLDILCAPSWKIGLIGSSFFMGWVLSILVIPPLADIYGRRWFYTWAIFGDLIVYIWIFITHSINQMIACMFLLGVFTSGRCSLGYVYMQELVPKQT